MIRRAAFVLVTAVTLLLPALPAAAQDDAIVGDLASLEGIDAAVQRLWLWLFDFDSIDLFASPVAENGLPPGLIVLQAGAARFESEAAAEAGFDTLMGQAEAEIELVTAEVGDDGEVVSDITTEFGDESFVYMATVPDEQIGVRVIIARSGPYILQAFGFGSDAASLQATDDLAAWMISNGVDLDAPAIFDPTGHSTGELWGFMPPNDAPFLASLAVTEDEILVPVPNTP